MRARVTADVRCFFASRGYEEVETPCLVPSPGLDVHLDAFEVRTPSANRYLHTSPEYQMKRLLADGRARGETSSRIFQVSRAFREGERGERHNPEFTILEFYRAPGTMDDTMRDTEQLVAKVTAGQVLLGTRVVATRPPFYRMTVAEAFERFADMPEETMLSLADSDEDTYFRLLVERVEPGLASLDFAIFLTHYPTSQASLARTVPHDPRYAERYELYVAGIELCNGFGELTNVDEQRQRFAKDQAQRRALGRPVYPVDERFLDALGSGLPPCSGNAIGLDRLAALASGTTQIAEVIAFTDAEL